MEVVLETLLDKKNYLERMIEKYYDVPEIVESFNNDIKHFEQVINIIELHIKIKNK
jgi:hypothetical protein